MGRRARHSAGVVPYKPLQSTELDKIEARRKALVLPVSTLGERAGFSRNTLQRIRASGRAWPREIRALKMALRSIERERREAEKLFPTGED